MPTQTINFANVNSATFNGNNVETIKLNNTIIWEKPTFVTTGYTTNTLGKVSYEHIGFASSAQSTDTNANPPSALGSWTGQTSIGGHRVDYIGRMKVRSANWMFQIRLLGSIGTAQPISKVTVDGLDFYPDYNYQNTSTTGAGVWTTSWTTGSNWTTFAWDSTYTVGGTNLAGHLNSKWGTSTNNKTVPVEIHT